MASLHPSHDASPTSSDEGNPSSQHTGNTPPHSPSVDSPFLSPPPSRSPSRIMSSSYIPSPLNPTAMGSGPTPRPRPSSRISNLNRVASEESHALAGQRGSMLLYRLASEEEQYLVAPSNRFSIGTDSIFSVDSKYPQGVTPRGIVPYVYDPASEDDKDIDADDLLHQIDDPHFAWSWRGLANVGLIMLLIAALLCLFIFYPVLSFFRNNARNLAIDGNIRINATGQAPVLFQMPELIDPDTPASAKTRTGFDKQQYNLVFSDEFNTDGRTFYPGDDPFWEAVDLWYWATGDLEWYDPAQVKTRGGNLVILMEQVANHGLGFRSGMLQSWNKFCFTSGYIEVSLSLPGPNEETQGYWPGVWTMGNLGRPGYGATTDGTWPYSYDACDVGTFPNQTWSNHSGPAAALHTDQGRAKYNFELSWLAGQKLSACTCPGEDHPGPDVSKGRGAPEIDVLEAQKNKLGPGAKVSQSAQFAPFSHDYVYDNTTATSFNIFNAAITQANTYHGSAVQQAVSGLTDLPPSIFNGTGGQFSTFGFEYWANPKNRPEGYIEWQVGGTPSLYMSAAAVTADQGVGGSGVSDRLIPEEPMSIVLNLAISESFQNVDLTSMTFPAELLIDYVRVYQRDGHENVGCNPKDYPTTDYINRHLDAYTNANLTGWNTGTSAGTAGAGYSFPKNSMYTGC
ncbi:beta-glucan synthesis-associated [Rickenella mellea]|uniref:Beta-glucan synthesis-associated n=1 Tax=Rickenella mellea TaxID=50990 RepID=A0A4Y7PK86_9AGAM|nr:beta-glucan synthesis-associated [Rickenella mellea]